MDGRAVFSWCRVMPVRVRTRRRGPPLCIAGSSSGARSRWSALHMLVPSDAEDTPRCSSAPIGFVQLVLTLFLAGIAVGQLVYGPLSDCSGAYLPGIDRRPRAFSVWDGYRGFRLVPVTGVDHRPHAGWRSAGVPGWCWAGRSYATSMIGSARRAPSR